MRRLVIATGNAHKLGELRELLPGIPLVGLDAFPPMAAPDEAAPDYAGNALIKARAAAQHVGEACLADDSGLEVEGLGWEPGVRSARYAPGTDADRRRALLAALVPGLSRKARFVCVIAVSGLPGGAELVVRGESPGRIGLAERGLGGFGYDPLFEVTALGRTFAELTAEEKHALSHRGRAAAALLPKLRPFLDVP